LSSFVPSDGATAGVTAVSDSPSLPVPSAFVASASVAPRQKLGRLIQVLVRVNIADVEAEMVWLRRECIYDCGSEGCYPAHG
jgi:hypothetical protein